ncbi:MAG: hypothetical protein JXJ17_13490 [Anaerolineae bacterium]|nr:hypothetical protein [Anaerolineae bacterium]
MQKNCEHKVYTVEVKAKLNAPPDITYPLFTAQGEYYWIPGWDTTFIFPEQPDAEPGTCFAHVLVPGKQTYWYTVQYDPELRQTIYVSVTPDIWIMRLDVTCEDGPGDTTIATLKYEFTSLSKTGETVIERLTGQDGSESFGSQIDGWINEYLATGKPVERKRGLVQHLHGLKLRS